jgi:MarR family transcriptional regulator, lower aerobic nicotinate degradation pathway regulator
MGRIAMSAGPELALVAEEEPAGYHVEQQIGFILRKANQRHVAIFAARIADLTPPQFAALSKLSDVGETSQNQLGTLVAMDAATIKGVIDRLKARGLVEVTRHDADKRRLMVRLAGAGREVLAALTPLAERITAETLAPLSPRERETLLRLLAKIS